MYSLKDKILRTFILTLVMNFSLSGTAFGKWPEFRKYEFRSIGFDYQNVLDERAHRSDKALVIVYMPMLSSGIKGAADVLTLDQIDPIFFNGKFVGFMGIVGSFVYGFVDAGDLVIEAPGIKKTDLRLKVEAGKEYFVAYKAGFWSVVGQMEKKVFGKLFTLGLANVNTDVSVSLEESTEDNAKKLLRICYLDPQKALSIPGEARKIVDAGPSSVPLPDEKRSLIIIYREKLNSVAIPAPISLNDFIVGFLEPGQYTFFWVEPGLAKIAYLENNFIPTLPLVSFTQITSSGKIYFFRIIDNCVSTFKTVGNWTEIKIYCHFEIKAPMVFEKNDEPKALLKEAEIPKYFIGSMLTNVVPIQSGHEIKISFSESQKAAIGETKAPEDKGRTTISPSSSTSQPTMKPTDGRPISASDQGKKCRVAIDGLMLRREPNNYAEGMKQLKMSDFSIFKEQNGDWCKILTATEIEGWVSCNQLRIIDEQ